jgi:hypothetical protein
MQFLPSDLARNRCRQPLDWFSRRHDFFVRRMFTDFFSIIESFQELYLVYISCRRPDARACANLLDRRNELLRTRIWDGLTVMVGTEADKGPLWQLKDLCHRLWPEEECGACREGLLIDWLIGSIFHEAMKLKENIYLLNSYATAAFKISDDGEIHGTGPRPPDFAAPTLDRMVDIKGLIDRIVGDVVRQMEQLAFFFGQSANLLRSMLPDLTRNMLLLRFLVEEEHRVSVLWGERLEEVFADIFFGAPEQGFCLAGRSYLNSQWYRQALDMYQRAVAVDPGCDEALAKTYQLKALVLPRDGATVS